jgi:hypothetical protein
MTKLNEGQKALKREHPEVAAKIGFRKGGKATHKTKDGRTAKKGLWYNIHQKRKRGGKPRKPGSKGAPTAAAFKRSAKTSKKS